MTYTLDANNNELTAASESGTYTFVYDALDRPTSQQEPFGLALTFGFDAAGNRISVQDSFGGLTTSVFDGANRLTTREFGGAGQTPLRIDLGYTARDQLATETRYSDLAGTQKIGYSTYSYDPVGRVSQIEHQNGSGAVLANFTYVYDLASRLTSETDNGSTTTYGYDSTNQLTNAGATTYSYDLTGNRTMTGYQTGPGNQLVNDGLWTYTFDSEGNEILKTSGSGEKWKYSYDLLNHLTSAIDINSSGVTVTYATYVYDVFGNRIEKDVWTSTGGNSTSRYGYEIGSTSASTVRDASLPEIWSDLSSSNTLQTRYLRGDDISELFARINAAGAAAWYLPDHLGSNRNLTDNTGTLIDTIAYDAYGNITNESSPSNGDRDKWALLQFDSEISLYKADERYVDPKTGRWLEQDPEGIAAGDVNLYRYAFNSTLNLIDPAGAQATVISFPPPIPVVANVYKLPSTLVYPGKGRFFETPTHTLWNIRNKPPWSALRTNETFTLFIYQKAGKAFMTKPEISIVTKSSWFGLAKTTYLRVSVYKKQPYRLYMVTFRLVFNTAVLQVPCSQGLRKTRDRRGTMPDLCSPL